MRRRLAGVDAELAAAVDRVAAAYHRLPEPRPDIAGERFHRLEAEVDRLCGAGDREAALRSITTWERETLNIVSRCLGAVAA